MNLFSLFPHRFLLPTKILSHSSLIPPNSKISITHNLNPQIPPKTTYQSTKTLKNGFLSSRSLDSIAKSERISNNFAQRRSVSSSRPGPFAPDAVPAVSSSAPINAGSSIRKPISLWPGMYHSPVTNALWEARSIFFEKMSNGSENGSPQSELITKNPSEGRTSILYKFSSDYILREQYRNSWNNIRMGKLLEDLDALAGTISFKISSLI